MKNLSISKLLTTVIFSVLLTGQANSQNVPELTPRVPAIQPRAVQSQKPQQARAPRKVNPAYQNPENPDPNLPNVLIIGDSISIGYMVPLREKLKGVANVYRPQTNCGPSSKGIEEINAWIGDRRWSLIQMNHGLHDLKYMGPKGQNLADPKADSSHQQIALRVKKTGATILWCETTPVPEGAAGRVVGDSKKYNAIAEKVMSEHGIKTNGLFEFASKNVPTREANVHYTPENSEKLAEYVAGVIKENLKQ